MEHKNNVLNFQDKEIRRVWHNKAWLFSIVDRIGMLTDSPIPHTYWSKLKAKILAQMVNELNPNWFQLKMPLSEESNYLKTYSNCQNINYSLYRFYLRTDVLPLC